MKKITNTRKCSALLSVGAGIAVCLAGSDALAVSGTGNNIIANSTAAELGGKIQIRNVFSGSSIKCVGANATRLGGVGDSFSRVLAIYAAGVNCNTAQRFSGQNASWMVINAGGADKYIKIKFTESGTTKYGWSQFRRNGSTFEFGAWSYNNTGANIKTLAESIVLKKLSLNKDTAKLHWTNANEEGVTRYEVQQKDSAGLWKKFQQMTPGEGSYSLSTAADAVCRLVVEHTDGSQETIDF